MPDKDGESDGPKIPIWSRHILNSLWKQNRRKAGGTLRHDNSWCTSTITYSPSAHCTESYGRTGPRILGGGYDSSQTSKLGGKPSIYYE